MEADKRTKIILFVVNDAPFFLSHRLPLALAARDAGYEVHVATPDSPLSGVILSIGRCAEDTAVIMLTGVVAIGGIPNSIFSKYEALPFYIFYIAAEYTSADELARGYGASLILLTITGILFFISYLIRKRLTRRW